MFRRIAFNVIARNCEDYTKNFAFRLRKGHDSGLAPAYNICFAYRPDSDSVSQHNLSINGKRRNFTKADLLAVAKSMNIKKSKSNNRTD
jgi:serine/threonine-protein kinase HipA